MRAPRGTGAMGMRAKLCRAAKAGLCVAAGPAPGPAGGRPVVPGGCSRTSGTPADYVRPQGPTAPWIIATPNPVPAARGFGKTIVNWWTGDGKPGQVYLSVDGGPEKLFSTKSSHEDARIGRGTYEFRLFAGTDHKT